ncbi:betaine/proline/choline family ABC transporter ATP-binding protein [Pediococcus claussenii]|uniref:Quaternary amine transport ATP-binding protein n=1 Tax=Pediococcus claussenii (strain ATCC BAA-344 / DSM 14800 / JCM 18046 / KCTC 3811 / LMG 21948 / P06) TaxID=701521 RepID=G8PBS7_PEDCP|nr:ABC transporter ATP-binding protein [Pediococcus claussenii]AEV95985.1 Glycine betaine/carnitine/choline ABC transporter, ATP-binding protein OpuCA [Pediococcus claussenii ATCC BAA-344]ANZ69471.1 glycine/betaine ABC transporter ATP-binding protein [Pediococcus claussenii]ANZ71291.1 glycine/betaine ABC transporter ATP-binding protein [Pediococcus claussenii]KRN20591.1 opuCA protein [Pediococcus claussenii]
MLLEMSHLSKVYSGDKVVVDDFNLNVERGEFICFIGTSGSGKTTTMRMINRMLKQTKGTIKINGQDITDMDPVKLRRKIGYVIQNIGLMPHLTIRENITMVPKLLKWSKEKRNERAKEMIKLVDLPEDFLDRYPSELSGGQQQRIGVVRALAADQDIILMDEPFGALDPITREDLQDLVKDLQERLNKTFIFVTHDMDEALRLASRIVVMSEGKQIQVDTPDNILKSPANDFVANLIGQDRLIQAKPSITTVGQVAIKPVSIESERLVRDALTVMHNRRVDTLLVTDADEKLEGVVSIEAIDKYYRTDKKVADIMDKKVFYVNENSIIRDTVDRILKRGFRNVPVVNNDGKLTGIVTRATLVDIVYDALWGEEDDNKEDNSDQKADVLAKKDGDQ